MYRVEYVIGNGYHCSCCRREETYSDDFETEEELKEWLIDFETRRLIGKGDDDDRSINSIIIVAADVTDNFLAMIDNDVHLNVHKKKREIDKKEQKLLEKLQLEREQKEKELLKQLKEKYETILTK